MAEATAMEIDKPIIPATAIVKPLRFNNKTIWGCNINDNTIVVGVGCIIYDPKTSRFILGNEINKLRRIQEVNPGQTIHSYFEDFGGKIEYKHANMHLIDVALSELYEETAMIFNIHYNDLNSCHYVTIHVPGKPPQYKYITFFVPVNLYWFQEISAIFKENLEVISNGKRFACQSQFTEISRINMFHVQHITDISDDKKLQIKGFYGADDIVYKVHGECDSEYMISSRVFNVIEAATLKSPLQIFETDPSVKKPFLNCDIIRTYGLTHMISKENLNEYQNIHLYDDKKKALTRYLHKFFISHAKLAPGVALGGDVPITYYNDIAASIGKTKYDITCPKVILYTPSLCMHVFDNVYMKAYTETDTTDIIMKKCISSQKGTQYSNGVFFELNDRIYFSCLEKIGEQTTQFRVYLGDIRLADKSITFHTDIIYQQTLAVDSGNAIAVQCINALREGMKSKTPILTYFDCDEISPARNWDPNALKAFEGVAAEVFKDDTYRTIKQKYNTAHVAHLQVKGKYRIFEEWYLESCKNDTYEVTGHKETLNEVLSTIKLSRCSGPFEMECASKSITPDDKTPDDKTPDKTVFDITKGHTFKYKGVMFASETMSLLPNFYLNQGLYDCFLIEPKMKSYVPLYRLSNADDDISFAFYSVASECIYPCLTSFNVKDITYDIIRVIKCKHAKTLQNVLLGDSSSDEMPSIEYYWRRIIHLY
jgi:hypothetical protein